MAVKSREFVGIAEGIRSHELSTQAQIESLRRHRAELSGKKSSLESNVSTLEAAIAAAYESTGEDDEPDYGLIASLEAELRSSQSQLSEVEGELDTTDRDLEHKENELDAVEEEKAQALFEIQERARKTSSNIAVAGGMFGAYVVASSSLQSSLQSSLSSLSQAASILGGSVDGCSAGSSGGSRSTSGGSGARGGGPIPDTDPLTALTAGPSSGPQLLPAGRFHSDQLHRSTPGTTAGLHAGHTASADPPPQNFASDQTANESALSAFTSAEAPLPAAPSANSYSSQQSSQDLAQAFSASPPSASRASSSSPGPHQHSFADWLDPGNYTKDGQYIGKGQAWGYQPYGKDAANYGDSIMTPAKQALNHYMQNHGYGRGDFPIYSMDPQWQKLHKAAFPGSELVNSLRGSSIARQHLVEYMNSRNYSIADFPTYSKDEQWQRLHQMAYPDSGVVEALAGTGLARQHLREYMHEHNYGLDDYSTYAKDPEWQRLHRNAFPENYSDNGRFCYGLVEQPTRLECRTGIDSSVRDLPVGAVLSDSLKSTFSNGQYRTVVAEQDIKLYRVFGGASGKEGTFLTSQRPTDRLDSKTGLALKAEWKNSRQQYCEVTIPKGTVMAIGTAAPQLTASGHVLPGGMDQIVIERNFAATHPQAFGPAKDLGFKTGYKNFEKKVRQVEAQRKKDDRDFVSAVLHNAKVRSEALNELADHVAELTESVQAHTEVCWLPKEHELPLAMAKADMLTNGLNTALLSVCLLAEAIKHHNKK